jgi:hypothetical protein
VKSRLIVLALLVVLAATPACRGYRHGFGMPDGTEGVRTVAVDIFRNKTTYIDLDFEFARALQREVSAKTPLRIATRGRADSVIAGAIESYHKEVLRENRADDVTRYSIVIEVSYTFTRLPSDGRPEKVIASARSLKRSAEYEVLTNATEREARAEAVRKLARQVVSHIFEQW